MKNLQSMTKPVLQQQLRQRHLPVDGTKQILISRLIESEKKSSRWLKEPLVILYYFGLYLLDAIKDLIDFVRTRVYISFAITFMILFILLSYNIQGNHQIWIRELESATIWYGYWVVLGIASSIGLGTGLHTFMLFLGPFIAQTTITAYKCTSLDFKTRGWNSFTCPSTLPMDSIDEGNITLLSIANKIKLECFFWGLGTAIGELPPYFVARAAASAGQGDEEFVSIEILLQKPVKDRTLSERFRIAMHQLLKSAGFFGILLCASIPNPLFDIAGIVCGHFGIPFFTFFGATMLGKAIIKTSIQSIAVIALSSKNVLEHVLHKLLRFAPWLHDWLKNALKDSADKFTRAEPDSSDSTSLFSRVWNGFLILMVLYFLLSMIESLSFTREKKSRKKT